MVNRDMWTLLAAVVFFIKPTVYLLVERHAARNYTPRYSYWTQVTSNLGVPYEHKDRETGQLTHSKAARSMNRNFVFNGVAEIACYVSLLNATGENRYDMARLILVVLYFFGMTFLAGVPGGPKEHQHWSIILHGIGALFAIACGNINSILVGLATPLNTNPIYRYDSIIAGASGLVGLLLTATMGMKPKSMRGLWQRSSIYPVTVFEYLTFARLALDLLSKS